MIQFYVIGLAGGEGDARAGVVEENVRAHVDGVAAAGGALPGFEAAPPVILGDEHLVRHGGIGAQVKVRLIVRVHEEHVAIGGRGDEPTAHAIGVVIDAETRVVEVRQDRLPVGELDVASFQGADAAGAEEHLLLQPVGIIIHVHQHAHGGRETVGGDGIIGWSEGGRAMHLRAVIHRIQHPGMHRRGGARNGRAVLIPLVIDGDHARVGESVVGGYKGKPRLAAEVIGNRALNLLARGDQGRGRRRGERGGEVGDGGLREPGVARRGIRAVIVRRDRDPDRNQVGPGGAKVRPTAANHARRRRGIDGDVRCPCAAVGALVEGEDAPIAIDTKPVVGVARGGRGARLQPVGVAIARRAELIHAAIIHPGAGAVGSVDGTGLGVHHGDERITRLRAQSRIGHGDHQLHLGPIGGTGEGPKLRGDIPTGPFGPCVVVVELRGGAPDVGAAASDGDRTVGVERTRSRVKRRADVGVGPLDLGVGVEAGEQRQRSRADTA